MTILSFLALLKREKHIGTEKEEHKNTIDDVSHSCFVLFDTQQIVNKQMTKSTAIIPGYIYNKSRKRE